VEQVLKYKNDYDKLKKFNSIKDLKEKDNE
jgi:hypothetical protein